MLRWMAAVLAAVGAAQGAGFEVLENTDRDPTVTLKIIQTFKEVPPEGGFPLVIEIGNGARETRTWTMEWTTGGSWRGDTGLRARHRFTVEPMTTRRFPVVVPVWGRGDAGSGFAGFEGPGVATGARRHFGPPEQKYPNKPTHFFAVSESLYSDLWPPLEKALTSGSMYPNGTRAVPELFGTDWTAYAGIPLMILRESEHRALTPAQREALDIWIVHGGRLILCGVGGRSTTFERGLGVLERIAGAEERIDPDALAARFRSPPPLRQNLNLDRVWAGNRVAERLRTQTPNAVVLLAIMLAFAVLVGPVNLLKFAPAGRRHRLFFTTPLISLGATVVLLVFILLKDGTGGRGERSMLLVLVPGANRAASIQVQNSVTGLTLGRAFPFPEREMLMLPTDSGAPSSRQDLDTRALHLEGGRATGDWFKSRAQQGQIILGYRPGREAITVLNPAVHGGGEAPEILSSIGATLDTVLYHQPGRTGAWVARDVAPGTRTVMTFEPGFEFAEIGDAPEPIRTGLQHFASRTGGFVARTSAPPGWFQETLGNIRWEGSRVWFAGLVETAEGAP